MEAIWLLVGIVVPRYARAVRAGHQRKIPQHELRAYHQSDAWAARRRAYNRTHPDVCVACLWLMPVAFWGFVLRLIMSYAGLVLQVATGILVWWFPPLSILIGRIKRAVVKVLRRLFKRRGLQDHHVTYKNIWDGEHLHPGCEKNRDIGRLCTHLPVLSRLFEGLSHHAAADRIRRLCERFGLPPVAAFRVWVLKCWTVQIVLLRLARTVIVVLWLR